MSRKVISDEQRSVLRRIAPLLPGGAYLAGGVAVAARLGHRRSRDLDWFVTDADPLTVVDALSGAGARIVSQAAGTLYFELDGIPVSLIRYDYPLLKPPEAIEELGVLVASVEDLATMKLSAIAQRGKARDFWDLHEIVTRTPLTLENALVAYGHKYPQQDIGHVVRSLVYFGDAEADPMPAGLSTEHWDAIKADLRRRVVDLPQSPGVD